jgi:arsenate reductase (thioredoxin)
VNAAVGRRLVAECTSTGLLVAVVVGSGIAATQLAIDGALRLPVNSLVTVPSAHFWRSVSTPSGSAGSAQKNQPSLLADSERHSMADIPEVLFVCTHNAGRSQMAATLLDQQAAGRIRVTSAGSQPADQLNPAVVQVMAEIGLDISREFPKPLTDQKVQAADVVIAMGCGDTCPVYPGKRYEDWDLPDPAGQDIDTVRRIRDQIRGHVQALADQLLPTAQPNTTAGEG